MTGILIIAKTPIGKAALLQHRADRLRESMVRRKLFDQLYTETVSSDEPYSISIEHRNPRAAELVPFESMKIPIIKAMRENGAVINEDYEVMPL